MHERVIRGGSHLLLAAIAMSASCVEAGGADGDAPVASASASTLSTPLQQASAPASAIGIGTVTANGAGCREGAMNVFLGDDYVHFFLTEQKLQRQDSSAPVQTLVCGIKAVLKGVRGQAFRLKRATTLGSLFLDSGAIGSYGVAVSLDGAKGLPNNQLRQVKGPFFDAWQENYPLAPVTSKCGADATLDVLVTQGLSGAVFGAIEVSDVIVSVDRQACSP